LGSVGYFDSKEQAVKKTQKRTKHIPQRTCVGCRQVLAKRQLMRIVRTADGVKYDPTGKASGRGAYLHDQRSCWERAIKGGLARALKTELSDEDIQHLQAIMETLSDDNEK